MNKILSKYDVTLVMKCQADGCKEDGYWQRIETLEKPSIEYSFTIKTNLCALHSTHIDNLDEEGTHHSFEIVHNVPLMA